MSFLRTGKELLYFEGVKIDATWRSENLDCVLRPHSKQGTNMGAGSPWPTCGTYTDD
jgi:hypothetical protein